jgi:hypothetical protein
MLKSLGMSRNIESTWRNTLCIVDGRGIKVLLYLRGEVFTARFNVSVIVLLLLSLY